MDLFSFAPLPSDFSRDKCGGCCRCEIDYIKILVAGYQQLVRSGWERCLDAKWSIGDCVAGCFNVQYDCEIGIARNSHQVRLERRAIVEAEQRLCTLSAETSSFVNFEELYQLVNDTISDIPDIGPLCIYDTALRLGWHAATGRIAPQAYVYIHQGARKGAVALKRLSVLLEIDYIAKDVNPAKMERIPIDAFYAPLRLLDANHLENFLCIFHRLIIAYADFIQNNQTAKTIN